MFISTEKTSFTAFQHIGQDSIPVQDTAHKASQGIRRTRIVIDQPNPAAVVKPADTTIAEKGYDPDQPAFTRIIEQKKEIWDVLIKKDNRPEELNFHYQPIFDPDIMAIRDSSDIAYIAYLSASDSGANNHFKNNLSVQGIKTDWMFGVILISMILLTWIKVFFSKYLDQIIGSLVNYQLSFKLLRDRNVLYARISVLLNAVFILNLGLFLYIILQYFDTHLFPFHGFINYLLYCALITVISFFQVFILRIIGSIFLRTKEFNEYIHNIFISNKAIGLFLLPIVISLPYIPDLFIKPLIYIGLGGFIILYLWRFVRGYKIIVSKDILKFYLILYFCTLEILPVLLIYKFLQNTVDSGGF